MISDKRSKSSGLVLEIQRMSTEDGPGLRSTVFFKGCPLNCTWCHNPESITPSPTVQWLGTGCLGCMTCARVCPVGAVEVGMDGITINRDACTGCCLCARECPSGAMEQLGTNWDAATLVKELIKDRAYFEKSGGGVTVSGGEPTMQPGFTEAVLAGSREAGVSAAFDTCGLCRRQALKRLLPLADTVLYDLKIADSGQHKQYTGAANERILENLAFVARYKKENLTPRVLWVRTPVIPGATDSRENIAAIGAIIAGLPGGAVDRWELCAFNNLCRDKYERLGMTWDFSRAALMTAEEMETLAEVAGDSGVDPAIVHWSGSTRNPGDRENAAHGGRVIPINDNKS